ncbi:MAG: PaaI family thioesterase [Dehalococcoidales bacterium]|nr:PaaI family thioesterase [Dehalococcoidales bacterium]
MSNWPQVKLNILQEYKQCFGCGQDNPVGLKLKFQPDNQGVRAEFTPGEQYQGWPGYLHGGITACILDEAMSHATAQYGVNCVTARLETKLTHMIPINQPMVITASVTKKTRKLIQSKATIYLKDGAIAAEGTATHFVVDSKPDTEKREKTLENRDS